MTGHQWRETPRGQGAKVASEMWQQDWSSLDVLWWQKSEGWKVLGTGREKENPGVSSTVFWFHCTHQVKNHQGIQCFHWIRKGLYHVRMGKGTYGLLQASEIMILLEWQDYRCAEKMQHIFAKKTLLKQSKCAVLPPGNSTAGPQKELLLWARKPFWILWCVWCSQGTSPGKNLQDQERFYLEHQHPDPGRGHWH